MRTSASSCDHEDEDENEKEDEDEDKDLGNAWTADTSGLLELFFFSSRLRE